MILMGDRGIPDGRRFMHGYMHVGHTLKLCNKAGISVFAQFHRKSKQGAKYLTKVESTEKSVEYATRT
jgi:catalase